MFFKYKLKKFFFFCGEEDCCSANICANFLYFMWDAAME